MKKNRDDTVEIINFVSLVDRFIDGTAGEWEWDDFISCRNSSPILESARIFINKSDNLLSSSDYERNLYASIVIKKRNEIAALVGLPTRKD